MENNSDNSNFQYTPNPARVAAVKVLSRFERSDAYLDKLMEHELADEALNPLDRGLLTEIVNGVVRWKWKLDWVLTGFYHGDYLKCLNIVKNSMRAALYQILFLDRIPIYAAINDAVEVVKKVQGEKTGGLVNGVLRNISRNIENIRYPKREDDLVYYLAVMYSHPRWMVARWLDRFGEEGTEELLARNNERPYMPIRINRIVSNRPEVFEALRHHKLWYDKSPYLPECVNLKNPRANIAEIDIFVEGKITVQDVAATLCTRLAAPKPGYLVYDLCAAPGGKSFSLAELMYNQGRIVALDKYSSKLPMIESGAERLHIDIIEAIEADARDYKPEEQADLVYADVPCSGHGTLSKKSDIKWKREREDIFKMVALQREILANAAGLVRPGGVLLYSTCTIEPEENHENIAWFLEQHPEFRLDPAEKYLPVDVCHDGYIELIPHIHNTDGAFAARLVKDFETE